MATQTHGWLPKDIHSLLAQHPYNQAALQQEQAYFVYDLPRLTAHIKMLQQQDVVTLWYAVKANPLSSIITTLANVGVNFDVASRGELKQVLAQQVLPKRILNTGPAKSRAQITEFIQQGVEIFVAESINQLRWLQQTAVQLNKTVKVLLRVQLQWNAGDKNPLGGTELTPFGLAPQQWQHINVGDYPNLNVCGLHIFQWGNLLCNKQIKALWQQMLPPLMALADALAFNCEILDLGGGLGLDYAAQQQHIAWPELLEDLASIKRTVAVSEIWLELGRYAVGQSGYYVVPVLDRKENYGQQQLILAAGINHLMRPALTEQAFPVALLRASSAPLAPFHLHGPLCTSLDKLGHLLLPNDVTVGDQLIFGYCGAYGFTESMPFFLCHDLASELVVRENQHLQLVRTAQTAASYLR
jgi:diaminopimelate decarboxylase